MKKDELIKLNEKLTIENNILWEDIKGLQCDIKILKDRKKLEKIKCIVGVLGDLLFLALVIMLISNTIITTSENKRTREMINNADACIKINEDIYCTIETE